MRSASSGTSGFSISGGRCKSRLRREQGLTYLLVTHNLPVVSFLCDRLAVMQKGRIVEIADVAQLKAGALTEAYSRELLAATEGA